MIESDEYDSATESEVSEVSVAGGVEDVAADGVAEDDGNIFGVEDYEPPKDDKQSCRWMGTLNNYTQEEWDAIWALPGVRYQCMAREVAPTTNTPHIQFVTFFESNQRFASLKKNLNPRISWTYPQCRDNRTVINYHKKGDQPKAEWKELKEKGPSFGISDPSRHFPGTTVNWIERGVPPIHAGERKDLSVMKESITENVNTNGYCDMHALLNEHFEPYARARSATLDWVSLEEFRRNKELLHQQTFEWEYRPYQRVLLERIESPRAREVVTVVDLAGNAGKTSFMMRLQCERPELNLFHTEPGKFDNMAYKLSKHKPLPKCVVVDTPRSRSEIMQYDFLEACKNGYVRCDKYTSGQIILPKNIPVLLFMNQYPDLTMLSLDRWYILVIKDKDAPPEIYYHDVNDPDSPGFPECVFPTARRAFKKADPNALHSSDDDESVYEPRESRRKRNRSNGPSGQVYGRAAYRELNQKVSHLMELATTLAEIQVRHAANGPGNRRTVTQEEGVPQEVARVQRAVRRRVDDHPLSTAERLARREA